MPACAWIALAAAVELSTPKISAAFIVPSGPLPELFTRACQIIGITLCGSGWRFKLDALHAVAINDPLTVRTALAGVVKLTAPSTNPTSVAAIALNVDSDPASEPWQSTTDGETNCTL